MPKWVLMAVCLIAPACGGDGEPDSCDDAGGIICNNCSASGDCVISCEPGQNETCVGLEFFGDDNPGDLRCAFCDG